MFSSTNNQNLGEYVKIEEHGPPLYVYSKGVTGDSINSYELKKKVEKSKLNKILEKLIEQGKNKKICEIELNENCIDWINSIFSKLGDNPKSPDLDIINDRIKYLLKDFSREMKTSMRQINKYVIAIIYKDFILLAHSLYGEETVTPDWEIFPRMIDKDNVLRYVLFKLNSKKEIEVRYNELYNTESFMDWLGISKWESSYQFGGKYRFYTQLLNKPFILELDDEDIESIKGNIVDSHINLENSIKILPITQIRIGKMSFDTFNEFMEVYMAEKYDLTYYSRKYLEIKGSLEHLAYKHFDSPKSIFKHVDNIPVELLKKQNINFDILFATSSNGFILDFTEEYMNVLFSRYINGEILRIFHAGDNTELRTPYKIRQMEIYNKLNLFASKSLIEYYNSLGLHDFNTFNILSFLVFSVLFRENRDLCLAYFFKKMANKFLNQIDDNNKILNREDSVIEYKGQEFFLGKDNDIISRIVESVDSKMNENGIMIFLIGVEEPPSGKITPILNNRIGNDRLNKIESELLNKSKCKSVFLYPIPIEQDSSIISILFYK